MTRPDRYSVRSGIFELEIRKEFSYIPGKVEHIVKLSMSTDSGQGVIECGQFVIAKLDDLERVIKEARDLAK